MLRSTRLTLYATARVAVRRFTVTGGLRATDGVATLSKSGLGIDRTVENNLQTDTNRLAKALTKFWEKVDTEYNDKTKHYEVRLDGKTLKTPLGFPLALPEFKKQLAHLIQHEWSSLPDLNIKTNSMPLTSLAARAIDLLNATEQSNEELLAKVGKVDDIKLDLLRYLDTDTCLIFTTHDECDGALRKRQDELYLPLIAEYESFFAQWAHKKGTLMPANYEVKLQYLDCETDGLRGNRQAITTQNIALDWLNELTMYELVAFEKAVLTTKSFLCAMTLLRSNVYDVDRMKNILQVNKQAESDYFFRSVDDIVELANMETIHQTKQWGEVEDTHDVDKVDWLRNLTSAALLCH